MRKTCAAILGLLAAPTLQAQETLPPPPIDPSVIEVPTLAFTPMDRDVRNYDKYYLFHRENTDFATAYADLRECDAYARGITLRADGSPFTGALTAALTDAIFGSALRREIRRRNMRVCMGFKEYRRYGLPKSIWERVNFEEGLVRVDEQRRQRLLQVQARIASGPRPLTGEIRQ